MNIPIVLIADDNLVFLRVIGAMAERIGYKVVSASDGAEAVELFKKYQHTIDFVFLDMYMPKMNGITAFENIRKLCQNVSVVVISGSKKHQEERSLIFLRRPVWRNR